MTSQQKVAERRASETVERGILWVFVYGALLLAIANIARAIVASIAIASGPVTLPGVPTERAEPAGFAEATFEAVTLTLQAPTAGVRFFSIAGMVLSTLLVVAICLVVAWLSYRLLQGHPFGHAATWGAGAVSILVFFCGLGVPIMNGMAAQRAALQLGVDQLPPFLVEVDPAPLGWALALAVVAATFEIGQRLQRDVTGLI